MNKKLKIAMNSCSDEQGFAIPTTLAIGLVMLLVGVTMIIRSQGAQVTASAQKTTARGLSASETGITRVQALLNKHRNLTNITLTNIASTPLSSSWRRVYDASITSVCSPETEISSYRINEWINVDNSDNKKGQFRIKDYTYKPHSDPAQVTAIIPASGSVTITNISPNDYLRNNDSVEGQIQSIPNIPGILSRNAANTYSFQRLGSGTQTNVTNATFLPSPSDPPQVTGAVVIPASGSVPITISPNDYLVDGRSVKGQIEGIQGTLSRGGGNYTFQRLRSGIQITTTGQFFPTRISGTATLTVEGRVNQAGTGNTATQTLSTANSQLVVNIPVNASSEQAPALWVKSSTGNDMNNDKVNGNILINSCPPPTGAALNNVYDPNTQEVIANPVVFPDTPALPPVYYTLTDSPFGKTFPRPGPPVDVPADDGYYHYLINDLVGGGNSEITITPGKKVIFYVKGNIDLNGNPDINKTPGNTSDQLQIYGNTYTSPSPTKYGCAPGTTLGNGCPTLKVHVGGTGTMTAFIHAPDATGSVNGGGNTNGNFMGPMWLKNWVASSGNSKVKIDAWGKYSDYLVTKDITPPLISPINLWQRQEVQP